MNQSHPTLQNLAARLVAAALLVNTLAAEMAWQHPHADEANSSFARINTPTGSHALGVEIGPLAAGANPVFAADGTGYVGTTDGSLRAFKPDGTPMWTRTLRPEHGSIMAAPVVGADGSIYAVSTIFREDLKCHQSFFHKFTPGGGWVVAQEFPRGTSDLPDRGATNAPLNMWRSNGVESIMVPVRYNRFGIEIIELLAFSTDGFLMGRQELSAESPTTTSIPDSEWVLPCYALLWWIGGAPCFIGMVLTGGFAFSGPPGVVPMVGAGFPMAGVAIMPDTRGGAPLVFATDRKHALAVLSFSPQSGFTLLRKSDHPRFQFTTTPAAMPDGTAVIGTLEGRLFRMDRDLVETGSVNGVGMMTASPTRLKDGTLLVLTRDGEMVHIGGSAVIGRMRPMSANGGGESIVSAAASCTRVYVHTTTGLYTFDADTLKQLYVLEWRGGVYGPVIGPNGRVYGVSNKMLMVFDPPIVPPDVTGRTACDVVGKLPVGGVSSLK
ncbi:MAG: hypothetical protein R2729_32920 [Bryobacteraceae bacterium]